MFLLFMGENLQPCNDIIKFQVMLLVAVTLNNPALFKIQFLLILFRMQQTIRYLFQDVMQLSQFHVELELLVDSFST